MQWSLSFRCQSAFLTEQQDQELSFWGQLPSSHQTGAFFHTAVMWLNCCRPNHFLNTGHRKKKVHVKFLKMIFKNPQSDTCIDLSNGKHASLCFGLQIYDLDFLQKQSENAGVFWNLERRSNRCNGPPWLQVAFSFPPCQSPNNQHGDLTLIINVQLIAQTSY